MTKESEYIIGDAGRVKAAGVSLDLVYDAARDFMTSGGVADAKRTTENFNNLRTNPPEEIRNRFFPRDRGNKAKFRGGSLLLRPILKTDQGAGQFLPFDFDSSSSSGENQVINYQIKSEEGYFVEEPFFKRQLIENEFPQKVVQEIENLRTNFRDQNIEEAQLAYERMQIACDEVGIKYQREVTVGRDAMFFIRPSKSESVIGLPNQVKINIEKAIDIQVNKFELLANQERAIFIEKNNLQVKEVDETPNLPLYFQADMQVLPGGEVVTDQLQIPDVGLFLLDLNRQSSTVIGDVQKRMLDLARGVITGIVKKANYLGTNRVNLITRDEVLQNEEDLLEQKEIKIITNILRERGITVNAITLSEVEEDSEKLNLFLNVDVNSKDFELLLKKHTERKFENLFPDPFLLKAREKMTSYNSVELTQDNIIQLRAITKEVDVKGSSDVNFIQLMALDNFLNKLRLRDDVFHMYISSQHTPVPCFRFDARGFQIALNYIQPNDSVIIRSVPISPEKSVLFDTEGRPLYCVFRTMFF